MFFFSLYILHTKSTFFKDLESAYFNIGMILQPRISEIWRLQSIKVRIFALQTAMDIYSGARKNFFFTFLYMLYMYLKQSFTNVFSENYYMSRRVKSICINWPNFFKIWRNMTSKLPLKYKVCFILKNYFFLNDKLFGM